MTDPNDPLDTDPLDELASAHLDGRTTGAEAARIAADPGLTERVARMAAARAALRSPDAPVDAPRRDAAIAAALAAFDAVDDLTDDAGAGAPLTPITAAGSRRVISRRTLGLVGAAAVAVLVALAVPLLGRLDSERSDNDVAATTLDESTADAAGRDASGGAATESAQVPAAADTFAAAGDPLDLGSFDDILGLEDAVRPLVQSRPAADSAAPTTTSARTPPAAGTAADTCGGSADQSGSQVLVGRATLDGRLVLVFVYERAAAEYELVIVDPSDCSTITTATFQ
jgi:hypothetical protein